jgi:biotin carboxyl carrier protein
MIEVGPSPVIDTGETTVYLNVDHHQSIFNFQPEIPNGGQGKAAILSKEEILDLAMAGDMRSPFAGNIVEISVKEGQEVLVGDRIAIMEAMKMQTPILSKIDGIVTWISVKQGDSLRPGDKILKIDKDQ